MTIPYHNLRYWLLHQLLQIRAGVHVGSINEATFKRERRAIIRLFLEARKAR